MMLPINKILLTVSLCLLFGGLFVTSAHAAEVVGNESYEVSWDGVPADVADRFQLYYNQADGGAPNTVFNGLTSLSRRVWLHYLKPCTSYNWSLKALKGTKGSWIRTGTFRTGGTCENRKTMGTATRVKPVLGAHTQLKQPVVTQDRYGYKGILSEKTTPATQVLGLTTTCTKTGKAVLSLQSPRGVTVRRMHVYYGTIPGRYEHALRNLDASAHEVTIGSLDTCATYYYQVAVVGNDDKVYWQGDKKLIVH